MLWKMYRVREEDCKYLTIFSIGWFFKDLVFLLIYLFSQWILSTPSILYAVVSYSWPTAQMKHLPVIQGGYLILLLGVPQNL